MLNKRVSINVMRFLYSLEKKPEGRFVVAVFETEVKRNNHCLSLCEFASNVAEANTAAEENAGNPCSNCELAL